MHKLGDCSEAPGVGVPGPPATSFWGHPLTSTRLTWAPAGASCLILPVLPQGHVLPPHSGSKPSPSSDAQGPAQPRPCWPYFLLVSPPSLCPAPWPSWLCPGHSGTLLPVSIRILSLCSPQYHWQMLSFLCILSLLWNVSLHRQESVCPPLDPQQLHRTWGIGP